MNKQTLLIVDSETEFVDQLAKSLRDLYSISCCSNGKQALELVKNQRPDLMVLDLMLPGIDGITLLTKINTMEHPPKILIISRMQSEYVLAKTTQLNISYYVLKPCDPEAAAERVQDLGHENAAPKSHPAPQQHLTELLLTLSIPTKLKGFPQLRDAILLVMEKPGIPLTKELYPTIGRRCQSTGIQVERAIRNAIDHGYKSKNSSVWAEFFPPDASGEIPHMSNGTFICRMAEVMRQWMEP